MLGTTAFGSTDMKTSRVGFGAWAIGGGGWKMGWGSQDDNDSIAAIRYAVEQGINWIDTAAVYGHGRSERVVGEALAGIPEPDRPYVFTKCGRVWNPDDLTELPQTVLTPESIRREVTESLSRLRLERIDLYQVHWAPTDGTPVESYWETMLALRDEGKVRHVGVCNHSVDQLSAAEELGHVDSLQPPLSLIRRDAAADVIPWADEHGTAVIAYSPMQSGLLTGAMSRERVEALPEDDFRRRSDYFTSQLDANLALVDAMRPVADRHAISLGALSIAWVLAWPGVTGAIVGARRPAQIDDWIAAADVELTGQDLDELADALDRTGAGTGPGNPATSVTRP